MSTKSGSRGPCSFRLEHYRVVLEAALRSGYSFVRFRDATPIPAGRICILRHDVDYMPEWAINFAQIEAELGLRSTFFFLTSAMAYNLRAMEPYDAVHAVSSLGHDVGVHVDLGWHTPQDGSVVAARCGEEKAIFRAITGLEPVDVVSFHNPTKLGDRVLDRSIEGVQHTYEPAFYSQIKYLSDSQGWYEGCACTIFDTARYEGIQLLTHPYVWPPDSTDFIEDMARMVKRRADKLVQYLVDHHPVCTMHEGRFREEIGKLWRS